jgi:hypothetical protein
VRALHAMSLARLVDGEVLPLGRRLEVGVGVGVSLTSDALPLYLPYISPVSPHISPISPYLEGDLDGVLPLSQGRRRGASVLGDIGEIWWRYGGDMGEIWGKYGGDIRRRQGTVLRREQG